MRHSLFRNLPLLALAGIGYLFWTAGPRGSGPPARLMLVPGRSGSPGYRPVRPAGPANMQDPPQRWHEVAEILNQSFPANDPRARY